MQMQTQQLASSLASSLSPPLISLRELKEDPLGSRSVSAQLVCVCVREEEGCDAGADQQILSIDCCCTLASAAAAEEQRVHERRRMTSEEQEQEREGERARG